MNSSLHKKRNLIGWSFILPATALIFIMNFYPMIKAFFLSLQRGKGNMLRFGGLFNYKRMLIDPVFKQALGNTFEFLIIQVPIMILFAIFLAVLLNDKNLKCKGLFRTAIFIPCATSLVSYAIIFRQLFAEDGLINYILRHFGLISSNINYLADPILAKMVIVVALLWRWTGYNMIFFLAGLQNIDPALYEAAKIDGATAFQRFKSITLPLLKPMILLTAIMSTNGTIQLFDEPMNLTKGGPAHATMSLSQYIYESTFMGTSNFPYGAAMSYVIFIIVAVLAFIQLKVGDKRD